MVSHLQDSRIAAIVARIPTLANATKITPLKGGLTNINYRIETPVATYMMRIGDVTHNLLGINRENERINTARAHQAGVGASVIDSLPEENVFVIGWIDAKALHKEDIHSRPDLLCRMANSIRKLHRGPAFQGEFHFPTIRKKYLKTVLENNYFLPDKYLNLEPLVLELEKIIAEHTEELVPCNNDLLAENFMDDGKKIWIIDYEYSGQNEASFEIGNLASEVFLNQSELIALCDFYWQNHLPSKINRAMAWSMIARFGWVLWASIQEAISPIDFNFRAWGMLKWNSVVEELNGNHYLQVLENLKKKS